MARVARGDERAFQLLSRRHLPAMLGLALRSAPADSFCGTSGQEQVARYRMLTIRVGAVSYKALVGFTELPCEVAGILGQDGFFSHFVVTLDQPGGWIILKPSRTSGRRPQIYNLQSEICNASAWPNPVSAPDSPALDIPRFASILTQVCSSRLTDNRPSLFRYGASNRRYWSFEGTGSCSVPTLPNSTACRPRRSFRP